SPADTRRPPRHRTGPERANPTVRLRCPRQRGRVCPPGGGQTRPGCRTGGGPVRHRVGARLGVDADERAARGVRAVAVPDPAQVAGAGLQPAPRRRDRGRRPRGHRLAGRRHGEVALGGAVQRPAERRHRQRAALSRPDAEQHDVQVVRAGGVVGETDRLLGGRASAATSPSTAVVSVPVKPGVTLIAVEPLAPAPVTWPGAAAGTGLTASWLRTENLPLLQVSEPNAYWSNGAVVRV